MPLSLVLEEDIRVCPQCRTGELTTLFSACAPLGTDLFEPVRVLNYLCELRGLNYIDPHLMRTYCDHLLRMLPDYRLKLILSIWIVFVFNVCVRLSIQVSLVSLRPSISAWPHVCDYRVLP